MLKIIDDFLKKCVVGFGRHVTPIETASRLPESVKKVLVELGCQQPEGVDHLEERIYHLQQMIKATNTSTNFFRIGVILCVCAIVNALVGIYLLALPVGIVGLIFICGDLRLSALYDIGNLHKRIEAEKNSKDLLVAWIQQLKAKKVQDDLSFEQIRTLNRAISFGFTCLSKIEGLLDSSL